MKITRVEPIMLRLHETKRVADGAQSLLLVKVHTDAGIVGIGELHTCELAGKAVIEAPFCSWSTMGLAEIVVGQDPLEIGRLWDLMYKHTSGYGRRGVVLHAISAIDMALWDILGKVTGQPIYQLLGGARRRTHKLYASDLDSGDPAAMLDLADRHISQGFKAMKFGWGTLGGDARKDATAIGRVRDRVGPDVDIMIDTGFAMPLDHAIEFGRRMAEHDVYFLEEPLDPDDYEGFRTLVAASPTPIATGEKSATVRDYMSLIDQGGLRIVQPDIARVGGFTEMLRIVAYADARGVRVIPHCWASDILVAATLHFLTAMRQPSYLEFCVYDQPLRKELAVEPIRAIDGHATVPEGPGLGIELNEDIVRRFRVD